MDSWHGVPGDLLPGVLHFVDQGQHIAGIVGIPYRQLKGKDKARGGLGDNAGFAAKLSGAVALAFANRGNREVVRIDEFTLPQGFAVSQPAGLGGDLVMGFEGYFELGVPALPLVLRQGRRALHVLLRGLSKRHDLLPGLQQLPLGLAHQHHKHSALAAALAAKAAHNLDEGLLELPGLSFQPLALGGALVGEVGNDLEDFFSPYTGSPHH